MLAHIFVYGTLRPSARSSFGKEMRERLARESRPLGAALMPGRLYDLGSYPGLVDSTAADEFVYGDVLELRDPAATFRWLDLYESIPAHDPAAGEYRRETRLSRLIGDGTESVSAREMTVWVYIYAHDLSRARRIIDGSWPG